MSVGEGVAALNATRTAVVEQQQRALAAADRLDQAAARLAAVIGTSPNPNARAAIQCLAFAAQRLREGSRLLAEAVEAIGTYVAVITGGSAAPPVGRPASSPPARAELAPTARFDPAKAAEIRPFVGRDQAIGRLYDADGRPVGELIHSGKGGPGVGGPGARQAKVYIFTTRPGLS